MILSTSINSYLLGYEGMHQGTQESYGAARIIRYNEVTEYA